jgi:hypothetical protein
MKEKQSAVVIAEVVQAVFGIAVVVVAADFVVAVILKEIEAVGEVVVVAAVGEVVLAWLGQEKQVQMILNLKVLP